MSGLPWVRFFPSDWLGGSRGMSASETGVYISLIAMMYERGEPLTEETARLARLCGASNSQFQKALESLVREGKIIRVEGGLWNLRVEKEQSYRLEKSEVGKQSAEKRWRKSKQNQQDGDANAMPMQCGRNANQKPEARSQKDNPATPNGVSPPSKRERGTRVNDFQPDEAVGVEIGLSPEQSHREAEKFRDYFLGAPGQKGVKQDWPATWRNWARRAFENLPKHSNQRGQHEQRSTSAGRRSREDDINAGIEDVFAARRVREPAFQGNQGSEHGWPRDRFPGGDVTLERGEDGAFGAYPRNAAGSGYGRH